MNDVPSRFWKVASDTLRSAMLKQAGAPTTSAELRKELEANRDNLIPNWSAFDAPFVLPSPDVDTVNGTIDNAIEIFESWDVQGRPAIS